MCSSLILLFEKNKKTIFLQKQKVICLSFVLRKDPVSHPEERERHLRVSYIRRISGKNE